MSTLILLVILLLLVTSFLFIYSNLNKSNLSFYLIMIILAGYILSFRNIDFWGLEINASSILIATIFPILSLYLEKFKLKEAKELLGKINIMLVILIIMLMLITGYVSSVTNDSAIYIQNIFGNNFRTLISYPISIIISLYFYMFLYMESKEMYNNYLVVLLISNSIISIVEILLFSIISYIFAISILDLLYFMAPNYIIRILIVIIYTFIIYSVHFKKKVKR